MRAPNRLGAAFLAATLALGPGIALGDDASPSSARASEASGLIPITLVLAGEDRGEFPMLVEPGDVWLPLAALRSLPFSMPAGVVKQTIGSVAYVSLHSLAAVVSFAYDESTLSVRVMLSKAAHLERSQTIDLAPKKPATSGAHADPSGFLNYSITGTTGQTSALGGYYELGVSNDAGHLTATGAYVRSQFQRGLIAYTRDDQRFLRRETIGDEVALSGTLGSSVVVGGIGYSRNFALAPGFLRDASPSVSGTVLSPTQADIYVNGSFYRTVTLEPGQFDLTDLPGRIGANVTQVVLHDANGTTTDLFSNFYAAPSVLSRGLNEYDYHVGFLRLQPFGSDDRYGPLAALGSYRVGLTNDVTVGASFEKSAGQLDGGPTLDLRLPIGTLAIAASASRASGAWATATDADGDVAPVPGEKTSGYATSFGYAYTSRRLNIEAFDESRSTHYSTVTLAPNAERATGVVGESVAVTLTRKLNVELSHVDTHESDGVPGSDLATLTFNDSPTPRATLAFTLQRGIGSPLDSTGVSRGSFWSIGTSLVLQIGASEQTTFSATNGNGAPASAVEFQKIAPPGLGLGYDVQVASGQSGNLIGSATYRSQAFDADTFVQAGGAGGNASATLAGSIDVFREGVFFSEPVQSAYGLVHVDGLENAPVYDNGLLAGMTTKRGYLVVPNLGPYVDNQISLGTLESLTNAVADATEKPLDPRFNSGARTAFAVHRVHIFIGSVSIVTADKTFAPANGSLVVESPDGPLRSDLGSEGEFYFENLPPGRFRATAVYSGEGTCTFELVVPKSDELQTDLGRTTCSVR